MGMIDQREKTIVFCATQDHALDGARPDQPDEDQHRPAVLRAGDGQRRRTGRSGLREFQDNEKTIPTILTTSQKLSTGVDARNVRNIVLMRPVNSMIEFKQIIGRGTRLYDGKDYFTIYDFVKATTISATRNGMASRKSPNRPRPPRPPGDRPPSHQRQPTRPPPDHPPPAKIEVKLADGKARKIQQHDFDLVLERRRHAHVGRAVPGEPVRRAARVLQGRGSVARHLERPGTRKAC
jgi:type I restriction enzyme R subunit